MKFWICVYLFILIINMSSSHQVHQQQKQLRQEKDFIQFFQGCRKQLTQWIGFQQDSYSIIQKCGLLFYKDKIFKLYQQMTEKDLSFNIEHFDLLRKYLKEDQKFRQSLKCVIDSRNTENQYFNEQRKFKYFAKFVKQHSNQGRYLFVQQKDMFREKGKKICNYFKAFFQYYYLNVLRPSQTLSTTFLRALTVRTNIFNHEDIAYCVDIQTHGTLAQNLESLDINNIYVKIPQIFNAIRFIKFKKECRDSLNIQLMKYIHEKLKNINMFKVMYHDYEPFVEIAAEKFGTSQIKLLARKFSHIFDNIEQYEQITQEQL